IRYPDAASPSGTRQYLIDTTPELRSQIIRAKIHRLDGVFFTHNHADHVFGLDDLRRFNAVMDAPLDIYAEPRVLEWLRGTFGYIFEAHKNVNQTFVASLIPNAVAPPPDGAALDFPASGGGTTWTPLRLLHGRLPI